MGPQRCGDTTALLDISLVIREYVAHDKGGAHTCAAAYLHLDIGHRGTKKAGDGPPRTLRFCIRISRMADGRVPLRRS